MYVFIQEEETNSLRTEPFCWETMWERIWSASITLPGSVCSMLVTGSVITFPGISPKIHVYQFHLQVTRRITMLVLVNVSSFLLWMAWFLLYLLLSLSSLLGLRVLSWCLTWVCTVWVSSPIHCCVLLSYSKVHCQESTQIITLNLDTSGGVIEFFQLC